MLFRHGNQRRWQRRVALPTVAALLLQLLLPLLTLLPSTLATATPAAAFLLPLCGDGQAPAEPAPDRPHCGIVCCGASGCVSVLASTTVALMAWQPPSKRPLRSESAFLSHYPPTRYHARAPPPL